MSRFGVWFSGTGSGGAKMIRRRTIIFGYKLSLQSETMFSPINRRRETLLLTMFYTYHLFYKKFLTRQTLFNISIFFLLNSLNYRLYSTSASDNLFHINEPSQMNVFLSLEERSEPWPPLSLLKQRRTLWLGGSYQILFNAHQEEVGRSCAGHNTTQHVGWYVNAMHVRLIT